MKKTLIIVFVSLVFLLGSLGIPLRAQGVPDDKIPVEEVHTAPKRPKMKLDALKTTNFLLRCEYDYKEQGIVGKGCCDPDLVEKGTKPRWCK